MPGLRPDGSTKGPSLWIGVTILAVAVVIIGVAIFGILQRVGDFEDSTVFIAPGLASIDLVEGEWRLWQADHGPAVDVSAIDVEGPSPVEFREVDSTDQFVETRNVGEDSYTEIAAFDVDEDGEYTFNSREAVVESTDLLVGRSTGSLIGSALAIGGWSLLGLFGGFVFLIGLIPLIMNLVNRHRAARSSDYLVAVGQAPPPS